MYSEIMCDLNKKYTDLKDFTGNYLREYEDQQDRLIGDILEIEEQVRLRRDISELKSDKDECFSQNQLKLFHCQINYFCQILSDLEELESDVRSLPAFRVDFISKNAETLKKNLESNQIDNLAKMIVIESEDYDNGCIFHYNDICDEGYAGHDEDFYEYLCCTCEEDCFQSEDGDVEEYESSHYLHLNKEDVKRYALACIEECF